MNETLNILLNTISPLLITLLIFVIKSLKDDIKELKKIVVSHIANYEVHRLRGEGK